MNSKTLIFGTNSFICESPDVRWPFLLFKKHSLEMTIDKNFSANNTGHTSQSSSVGSAAADCRDKNTNELHLNLRCWLHFPFDFPSHAPAKAKKPQKKSSVDYLYWLVQLQTVTTTSIVRITSLLSIPVL